MVVEFPEPTGCTHYSYVYQSECLTGVTEGPNFHYIQTWYFDNGISAWIPFQNGISGGYA